MGLFIVNIHGDIEGDYEIIKQIPSVENNEELTNEKAIAFLQDNGWLVEHDRIMTSGMENKGKWIPVSERLPEIGSQVLVFLKDGYIGTDDYFSYGFDDFKDDVIAWMSLPEPYVEKGESL